MKVLTTILIAILISGCKSTIEKNVLVLGDSLNAYAAVEINSELLLANDAGYFPMSNAIPTTTFSRPERGSVYLTDRVRWILAAHQVDDVVISLGANDAVFNLDPTSRLSVEEMTAAAGTLIEGFAGRRIIWILPHDGVRATLHTESTLPDVLRAIRSAAAGRQNVRLISFDDYVTAHGTRLADVCLPGDIHLNNAGRALWAQMIHEALML